MTRTTGAPGTHCSGYLVRVPLLPGCLKCQRGGCRLPSSGIQPEQVVLVNCAVRFTLHRILVMRRPSTGAWRAR